MLSWDFFWESMRAHSVEGIAFSELKEKFCSMTQRVDPDPALAAVYRQALERFATLLREAAVKN